jgi:hypothetical protein
MAKVFEPQFEAAPCTAEINAMLARAQQGDRTVLAELRAFLGTRPDLWHRVGDLAAVAREAVLNLAAGSDLLARECLSRMIDERRVELEGPEPTPLERLLVDRVVLCWAQAHLADLDATRHDQPGSALAADARKRLESGQRRYLQAIKMLATVSKLLKPAISPVDLALRTAPAPAPKRAGRAASRTSGVPVLN